MSLFVRVLCSYYLYLISLVLLKVCKLKLQVSADWRLEFEAREGVIKGHLGKRNHFGDINGISRRTPGILHKNYNIYIALFCYSK